MANVSFYLLDQAALQSRLEYACRIIEKAYRTGHKVYIHAQDKLQAHELDEILWNFKPEAFVPHNLSYEETSKLPPVQIGFATDGFQPSNHYREVLVNLADDMPSFVNQFTRVVELLCQHDAVLTTGRVRWKQYKQQGHEINKYDIKL